MLRFGKRCFAPGKGARSVPAVRDRWRWSSRPLAIAVLFLLAAPLLRAQEAPLVILEKAHSLAGFYTLDGQRVGEVKVGPHPHEMVVSPDGRFLYTTDNGKMRMEDPGPGGNTISIVEIETRRKVGEINLGESRRPHGIDLDPRTNRLVVTTENPDQLLLIDLKSRRILRRHDTKGKTSHMVTLGPSAQWAYVSNSGSGNVSAIHVATGEVKLIPAGERTQQSVLSRDGKRLYVVSKDSDQITVIDTRHQERWSVFATGRGPSRLALTPDGKTLVYSLGYARSIGLADVKSQKQIGQIAIGGEPVSLALSRDGKLAYAAAQTSDRVYVLSLADRMIVRVIKTPPGSRPDAVLELPSRE